MLDSTQDLPDKIDLLTAEWQNPLSVCTIIKWRAATKIQI